MNYAKIVKLFLSSLNIEDFSVVGHSFGGKIASILNPKNLILLSSAGIVTEKPLKVKIKIKLFKFLKTYFLKAKCINFLPVMMLMV